VLGDTLRGRHDGLYRGCWYVAMLHVLSSQTGTINSIRELDVEAIRMSILLLHDIFCKGIYLYGLRILLLFFKKLAFCLKPMNIKIY